MIDEKATAQIKAKYSSIAPLYDFLEAPMERLFHARFRRYLFSKVPSCRVLELGVGTGRNLPYYPQDARITAVDISPAMLKRARSRSGAQRATFFEMDAQALEFADESFDMVVATFVFCSVPDAVLGLAEARRVCKRSGRLLILEHVRPNRPFTGRVFDLLNPAVRRILGPEINRRTVVNVRAAGWMITAEEDLFSDVIKLIEAKPELIA